MIGRKVRVYSLPSETFTFCGFTAEGGMTLAIVENKGGQVFTVALPGFEFVTDPEPAASPSSIDSAQAFKALWSLAGKTVVPVRVYDPTGSETTNFLSVTSSSR